MNENAWRFMSSFSQLLFCPLVHSYSLRLPDNSFIFFSGSCSFLSFFFLFRGTLTRERFVQHGSIGFLGKSSKRTPENCTVYIQLLTSVPCNKQDYASNEICTRLDPFNFICSFECSPLQFTGSLPLFLNPSFYCYRFHEETVRLLFGIKLYSFTCRL